MKSLSDLIFDFIKDKLMAFYAQVALGARSIVSAGIFTALCIMLLFGGLVTVHIALYILLPWTESTKGYVLLALGLVYFLVPAGLLSYLLSKRRWLRLFKAE